MTLENKMPFKLIIGIYVTNQLINIHALKITRDDTFHVNYSLTLYTKKIVAIYY